jgi:hypothetical protein
MLYNVNVLCGGVWGYVGMWKHCKNEAWLCYQIYVLNLWKYHLLLSLLCKAFSYALMICFFSRLFYLRQIISAISTIEHSTFRHLNNLSTWLRNWSIHTEHVFHFLSLYLSCVGPYVYLLLNTITLLGFSNVLTISVPDTPLTQWRLFQKRRMRNKLDIYVFINLLHYIYNQKYFPYCVVFVLFILSVQCCQFLWIVHSWLPLRFSLTFITFLME